MAREVEEYAMTARTGRVDTRMLIVDVRRLIDEVRMEDLDFGLEFFGRML